MKSELGIREEGCVAGCAHRLLVGLGQFAALSVVFGFIVASIWASARFTLINGFTGLVFAVLVFVAIFALDLTMKGRVLNIVAILAFEIVAFVLLVLRRFEILDTVAAYIGITIAFLVFLKLRGFLTSDGPSSSRGAHPKSASTRVSIEERVSQKEQDMAWAAYEEGERVRQERLANYHRDAAD